MWICSYGGTMQFDIFIGQQNDEVSLRRKERKAVRGVILHDGMLLMIKTAKGDYKFPGGGQRPGESDYATLVRELREESGFSNLSQQEPALSLLGVAVEQNRDTEEDDCLFCMESRYYFATLADTRNVGQQLDGYEKAQDFSYEFVPATKALAVNRELLALAKSNGGDINFWVHRETSVLEELCRRYPFFFVPQESDSPAQIIALEDYPELKPFLCDFLEKTPWNAAKLLAEFHREKKFFTAEDKTYFLFVNGSPVSFLTLAHEDCVKDAMRTPWIGFVFTQESCRGKKYSLRLIENAMRVAAQRGHSRVFIATDHIGLYERFGFTYEESVIDIYGEECRVYSRSTDTLDTPL